MVVVVVVVAFGVAPTLPPLPLPLELLSTLGSNGADGGGGFVEGGSRGTAALETATVDVVLSVATSTTGGTTDPRLYGG